MGKNLCLTISSNIHRLKSKLAEIRSGIETARTLAESEDLKFKAARLGGELAEVKKMFGADLFVHYLEKPETWNMINNIIEPDLDRVLDGWGTITNVPPGVIAECLSRIRYLFNDINLPWEADNWTREEMYLRFCERFDRSEELKERMKAFARESGFMIGHVKQKLEALFLDKLSSDEKLSINLPFDRQENFGMFAEEVNVCVQGVGSGAAGCMLGGRIETNYAENYAGDRMEGGVLKIGKAKHRLGRGACGGVIICDEADSEVAASLCGATMYVRSAGERVARNATSGTILVDECESLGNNISRGVEIYRYLTDSGEYGNIQRLSQNIITNENELEQFLQARSGLAIMDETSKIKSTKGSMYGGILVMKKCPAEVGAELYDGIVIVEEVGLTIDEARGRISEDRPGGAIMMRVTESEGKLYPLGSVEGPTKLIDLEDDFYGKAE